MINKKKDILLHILFALLMLICILPIILVVSISLSTESSIIENGYRFIPKIFSADAYKFIIEDGKTILTAYKNTIFTAVVGTVLNVLILALYGYSISRKDFPFRGFFSALVLITILFNGGLAPAYNVKVNLLGLKNTYTVLILSGLGLGFNAFMMKSFFATNVPYEIIESGKIDGAGETRIFFQLALPMAIPIMAVIGFGSLIGYWNSFQSCMLFIEEERLYTLQYTMQKALMNMNYVKQMMAQGAVVFDEQAAELPTEAARMAMAVFGVGPIIFAYPFFQRFFISGLTVGAVKG